MTLPALSPVHAGLMTFAHPAKSHCQPTYTQIISQNHANPVLENTNREIDGSDISI